MPRTPKTIIPDVDEMDDIPYVDLFKEEESLKPVQALVKSTAMLTDVLMNDDKIIPPKYPHFSQKWTATYKLSNTWPLKADEPLTWDDITTAPVPDPKEETLATATKKTTGLPQSEITPTGECKTCYYSINTKTKKCKWFCDLCGDKCGQSSSCPHSTCWSNSHKPPIKPGSPNPNMLKADACASCLFCPDCCSCTECSECDGSTKSPCYHPLTLIEQQTNPTYLPCYSCCEKKIGSHDHHLDSRGSLKTTPWETRGIIITSAVLTANTTSTSMPAYWKIPNKKIDPLQNMANFYLLDGIAHLVFNCTREMRSNSALALIADKARQMQNEIIRLCDPAFINYADMAIGGELRHHGAVGSRIVSSIRTTAWRQWRHIRDLVGVQALLDAAVLFRDISGGSIGGERWAVAAEILHARLTNKIDARTFVDRVFNLQHNGGMFINKIQWAIKNEPRWDINEMKDLIGPAHDSNPTQFGVLLAAASPEVRSLVSEWWSVSNKVRRSVHLKATKAPSIFNDAIMDSRENPYLKYTRQLPDRLCPMCDTKNCQESSHRSYAIWMQVPALVQMMSTSTSSGQINGRITAWILYNLQCAVYAVASGGSHTLSSYMTKSIYEPLTMAQVMSLAPQTFGGNKGKTPYYLTSAINGRLHHLMLRHPQMFSTPTSEDHEAAKTQMLNAGGVSYLPYNLFHKWLSVEAPLLSPDEYISHVRHTIGDKYIKHHVNSGPDPSSSDDDVLYGTISDEDYEEEPLDEDYNEEGDE